MTTTPDALTFRPAARVVGVAYATKYGSTREIAERIADVLCESGIAARAVAAADVDDLSPYDAMVLGSAIYMGRWLPEAWKFIRRHRGPLAAMPVWLFSSGPVGEAARHPDEGSMPLRVRSATERLAAREHRTFGGRVPPDPKGFIDKAVAGKVPDEDRDARDWASIEAWAREIAGHVQSAGPASGAATPASSLAARG